MAKIDYQENARVKYSAVLNLKASEGEIQWSRYNAMLVVNTLIIGFIGLSYKEDLTFSWLIKSLLVFVPILGILLCRIWYQMTDRGFMWTKYWMLKANEIENEIKSNTNPIQEGKEILEIIGEGITKKSSLLIIKIFTLVYLLILINNFLPH